MTEVPAVIPQFFLAHRVNDFFDCRNQRAPILRQEAVKLERISDSQRGKLRGNIKAFDQSADFPVLLRFAFLLPVALLDFLI